MILISKLDFRIVNKVSVVIRNKNEAGALQNVLNILVSLYFEFIAEIIVIDNQSTDNSRTIAKEYNCRIDCMDDFTYGKAINRGIELAQSKYILLLSSHAAPVGKSFFSSSFTALEDSQNVAGIRYVNSFENYNRALKNNFEVKEPLYNGLMAACCLVNREVWDEYKFNEDLVALEDKEWSLRVMEKGYKILDLNETYFYFINRDLNSSRNRFKNETIAECQLHHKSFSTPTKSLISFFKKILWTNNLDYLKVIFQDIAMFKTKMEIYASLKEKNPEI